MRVAIEANQCKNSVIQNIAVSSFDSFADLGLAAIAFHLFNSKELDQDHVGQGGGAHFSPGLIVIVIFVGQEIPIVRNLLVVIAQSLVDAQRFLGAFPQFQLNQGHDGVIYHRNPFGANAFTHTVIALLFNVTNSTGLDVELIGEGWKPKNPPRGSVVSGFGLEQGPALQEHVVKSRQGLHGMFWGINLHHDEPIHASPNRQESNPEPGAALYFGDPQPDHGLVLRPQPGWVEHHRNRGPGRRHAE